MTRQKAPASAPTSVPVTATLKNIQYSSGARTLYVLYPEPKNAQKYKSFQVMLADQAKQADHTALVDLKKNKITITQKVSKQKLELSAPIFAVALKALKEGTKNFQANKQGLLYLCLKDEGVVQADRRAKTVKPAAIATAPTAILAPTAEIS